jgi:hypothetical protein
VAGFRFKMTRTVYSPVPQSLKMLKTEFNDIYQEA